MKILHPEEFFKGCFKYLGQITTAAIVAWVAIRMPQVRAWASHYPLSHFEVWLLTFGVTLLAIIGVLRSLKRPAQKPEPPSPQIVCQTQSRGRPSPQAFEVLKWLNQFGPQAALNVDKTAQIFRIQHEEALTAVRELHEAGLIITLVPGPGDWNGHYGITRPGRECVRRYAT